MKYIDAHCHISNAPAPIGGDVVGWVCNATKPDEWAHVVDAARGDARIIPAIGIHPWHIDSGRDGWESDMRDMIATNPNLMVGEIGLDWTRPDHDAQMDVFIRQIAIATEYNRAIHVHCVRAWDKILHIFKTQKLPPIIVLHAFSAGADVLRQLMKYDQIYYSFSPRITPTARAVVCNVPQNRILVESDGGWDTSATALAKAAGIIAEIKSQKIYDITEILFNNAVQVIKNGQTAQNTFIDW